MTQNKGNLKYLFEKGRIGNVELKNRIVVSPFVTLYGDDLVTDQLVDFYAERAKGGAGNVHVSYAYVDPLGRTYFQALGINDDKYMPGLKRLADAIHEGGAKATLHLAHGGKYAPSSVTGMQAVSPSAIFSKWTNEMPRELTVPEIKQIIEKFAEATRRAREAGWDFVEYNAYSGYIIREFLSLATNKRTDEYGGDLNNRFRFFREIIQRSREEAGADYPLIGKISGNEFVPEGNTLEEALFIAKELEKEGVSAIHVSPGGHDSTVPLTQGFVPRGAFLYMSEAVKKEVSIPVITAHVSDIFLAEKALKESKADFIAFARQLIAEPNMPNLAREGKFDDIARCTRCCEGCYDRIFQDLPMTCSVNPRAGLERETEMKPAKEKKKVLVIGGGPAGMEAARVAAQRGHEVTLCDNGRRLGGSLLLAGILNTELPAFLKYLVGQVQKLPIEIKLNTAVNRPFVEKMNPDAVVVAVGGEPHYPDIPGLYGNNVLLARDMREVMIRAPKRGGVIQRILWKLSSLFARHFYNPSLIRWGLGFGFPFKKRVVIIGGGFAGCELAEVLSEKGKKITVLEESKRLGYDVGMTNRGPALKRLRDRGVRLEKNAKVTEITKDGVKANVDGSEMFFEADTVVLTLPVAANEKIAKELEDKRWQVYNIGDGAEPGRVLQAMASGLRAGYDI
ncbi:MAG: FAD-dependent oxidoreductase [Pseudomonadota bacterium]